MIHTCQTCIRPVKISGEVLAAYKGLTTPVKWWCPHCDMRHQVGRGFFYRIAYGPELPRMPSPNEFPPKHQRPNLPPCPFGPAWIPATTPPVLCGSYEVLLKNGLASAAKFDGNVINVDNYHGQALRIQPPMLRSFVSHWRKISP